MSSLVCQGGNCTFTRVDTNGFALNPFPTSWPTPVVPDFPTPVATSGAVHQAAFNAGGGKRNRNLKQTNVTNSPSPSSATVAPALISASGDDLTSYPWTDANNQDFLSETVAITRDFRGSIFNALDPTDSYNTNYGPANTEWVLLPDDMTYEESRCNPLFFGSSWYYSFAQGNPRGVLHKPGVVHVINEDLYYNIMFTNYTYNGPDDDYYYDNVDYGKPLPGKRAGGGFQYIRDKSPIDVKSLPPCPVCDVATTRPKTIRGPIDDAFVKVSITNVSPKNATIKILAVGQDSDPKCNNVRDSNSTVRPNAKNIKGNSVMLRRTKQVNFVAPFWYTIYFEATSKGGTCQGQARVCVPLIGLSCDSSFYQYDATTSKLCLN